MNVSSRDPSAHPGTYIKTAVLPKGLSVKKAAELMGVGRPALSNLLNGKAALTPDMAVRFEKAFGANAQDLLGRQAAYDEFQHREQAKGIAVRTYIRSFLAIEARQISSWSDQTRARAELPALLRRLVHSTATELAEVDFPAFDNAQRPGWDGTVSADSATPWIPRGESGWEFGCNQNAARKADDDYEARTASVSAVERKNTTFVFVTPRNWPGKNAWAETKRQTRTWKDVRAYDASDLEQWLEQSVTTQAWFAEIIGNGAEGISTLEDCWRQWAQVSEPPLSTILFRSSVDGTKDKLRAWLAAPPATPFVVAADSELEALAFLSCALEMPGANPQAFYDRAIVLKTVEALRRTTAAAPNFIAIVCSSEVELASAGLHKTHHLLIVRRRNDIAEEADITLDLVDDQTYREALTSMGLPEEDYQRYARDTGNSPTILRRRLSKVPAIRAPAWSTDTRLARNLIPLNLAGVWDSDVDADRQIMRLLANAEYPHIEQAVTELRTVADAPVWSIGKYRGVASKLDVLFATHNMLTAADLDNFFFAAQVVLSESDPALELPPDKQWAANIHGKTRQHSAALRQGICESLVLLAVHGNHLFRERLGIDVQARVSALVRALLLPLDEQTWASQKVDLPRYAEAAPSAFLEILEQDLESACPKIHALLQTSETMPFGGCPRTGLLWALETLAWNPDNLLRVSVLLAKLATIPINDNWSNKPEESLESIYRSWMPQTAASIDQRNLVMEAICKKFPDVGWRLCIGQFGPGHAVGDYSARPHWRNDAVGAGQTVKTWGEVWRVTDKARALALAWPNHNEKTLGDLVDRLGDIPEGDQAIVWQLIRDWIDTGPGDTAKHLLRERVRRLAFTRVARNHEAQPSVVEQAHQIYASLAPGDLVVRHLWLFAQHWIDVSIDGLESEEVDYKERQARVSALRREALSEISQQIGYTGFLLLCELGDADSAIGWQLADGVIGPAERKAFLNRLANQNESPSALKVDNMLSGFLGRFDVETRRTLLADILQDLIAADAGDCAIRLLKCSPFRAETWAHLELLPVAWRDRYWRETYVRWEQQDQEESNTLVDRLLEAHRPRAAFNAVHMDFDKLETVRLTSLLRAVATSTEAAGSFTPAAYEVSRAFKSLSTRNDVSRHDLAQLEFMYVAVLNQSDYGIPTLETELARDARLFVQLVALVYLRKDGGVDPAELSIPEGEQRRAAATTAHTVLRRARGIPGAKHDGTVDPVALRKWIDDVRALARSVGRADCADRAIGEILGKCAIGTDGVWPCESVRQVIDAIASQNIAEGMAIGRYNMRGAQWRGEGGSDEHGLAAQYRSWAKAVVFQYPFTARLLEEMARTYDHQAVWHDTEASVRKRINY